MDRVIALRQICITAQCYSSILFRRWQENPSSKREGMSIYRHEEKSAPACGGERERERERARERERERERESELALALLFICLSLPAPVLCKLGQPGVLFVLPEVLTLVLGHSFVLFWRAFPFLVL